MSFIIPVGRFPNGVAVNEVTNKIYVANQSDDTVSVIDGKTNTVIKTIVIGTFPRSLAVNEVTNKIYVSNIGGTGTVSVIDGDPDTVIKTIIIGIGNGPNGVAVNKVTNTIYVANNSDDTVSVIDGNTDTVIPPTLSTGDGPISMAVNEITFTLYVVNFGDDTVSVIDLAPQLPENKFEGLAEGAVNNNSIINAIVGNQVLFTGDVVELLPVGSGTNFTSIGSLTPRVGLVTSARGYGVVVGGNQKGVYGDGLIPSTIFDAQEQGVIAGIENDSVRICTQGTSLASVTNATNTVLQVGTALTPYIDSPTSINALGTFKKANEAEPVLARLLQRVPLGTFVNPSLQTVAVSIKREKRIISDWFDISFKHRNLITINTLQVPTAQSNFPFLLNEINNTDFKTDNLQTGGEDIRFADLNKIEFDVEVERVVNDSVKGDVVAWTNITSITDGFQFYVYYGKPSASFPSPASRQAVWSNYSAVYHMNQTIGGSFSTKDSTGNNDGTPQGTPNFQAIGQINGDINFDGAGDLIIMPDDDSLEPRTGAFSVSAWLKSSASSSGIIVAKQNRSGFFNGWALRMIGQKVEWDMEDDTGVNRITIISTLTSPVDTFEHAALTYDGLGVNTGLELYRNGVPQTATRGGSGGPVDDVQTVAPASIASAFDTAVRFPGDVDEVRISKDEKSADFLKTEFNNQSSPSTFYTIGPIQSIP